MKRSRVVTLVISGALAAGCHSNENRGDWTDSSQTYTNNQYVRGHGYYHAPYHRFYPMPYNHYDVSRGYYHGGTFNPAPHQSAVTSSRPLPSTHGTSSSSSVHRGGFTSHSSSSAS